MKKILFILSILLIGSGAAIAQDDTPEQNEFDKKYRFGLRITPQPTWLSSGDKNNIPNGAYFGLGFGLNVERKFSKIVSLFTGIGGDFEGAKYSVRYEPDPNKYYVANYWMDQSNEIVKPKEDQIANSGTTVYVLKERLVKTTHITVPLILKLSTQEYGGLKYFGMFGAEIGFRVNSRSDDSYYESRVYSNQTNYVVLERDHTQTNISFSSEMATIPARFGLNAGLGTDYRIAGTTSLLISVNYFRSFTGMMKNTSETTFYDYSGGQYRFIKQDLKLSGIRINFALMF